MKTLTSHSLTKLTMSELKEMIYNYYYGSFNPKDCADRELIVTKINDYNGAIGTVLFSLNGSPPKGRALMLLDQPPAQDGVLRGNILFFASIKYSKKFYVEITE